MVERVLYVAPLAASRKTTSRYWGWMPLRMALTLPRLRRARLPLVRFSIRVRPGAGGTTVGGAHDGALVVRVPAPAVDGRATEAALTAVAESLGVRRSAVRLVTGATSRTKVVEVEDGDPGRLAELLSR